MSTFPVPGGATFMKAVNNLADVASASAAAANIGALQVANNLSDVASKATALANLGGLGLVATTGVNGFALQNGTPSIISWTAPNDGNLHRVTLFASLNVTAAETGGQIQFNWFGPWAGATVFNLNVINAGQVAATHGYMVSVPANLLIGAGTTVTLMQSSALTVGAATLYAEIWAL